MEPAAIFRFRTSRNPGVVPEMLPRKFRSRYRVTATPLRNGVTLSMSGARDLSANAVESSSVRLREGLAPGDEAFAFEMTMAVLSEPYDLLKPSRIPLPRATRKM